MRLKTVLVLTACALAACGPSATEDGAGELAPAMAVEADTSLADAALARVDPVDYSDPAAWLCRPGADDACSADARATTISADGRPRAEAFAPAPQAPIDCFYVYPTVSLDPSPNSDIVPGDEEKAAALFQIARFASACRVHAPMYRQVTLHALRQLLRGETPATDREMAYADVRSAWLHYLEHDNDGRGVVLVGHSQGAGLLARLIGAEIDGRPAQDRLVSALLIGSNLPVPASGRAFSQIELCTAADDTGCVIAYASFHADAPPREGAFFGAVAEQGSTAACVNPALIDGSEGALRPYLPSRPVISTMAAPGPWTAAATEVETPFVALPGLLSAQCVEADGYRYLAIATHTSDDDSRTGLIGGDVVVDGAIQPGWGLHLIDINLAMGNLTGIVKRQGEAWLEQNR